MTRDTPPPTTPRIAGAAQHLLSTLKADKISASGDSGFTRTELRDALAWLTDRVAIEQRRLLLETLLGMGFDPGVVSSVTNAPVPRGRSKRTPKEPKPERAPPPADDPGLSTNQRAILTRLTSGPEYGNAIANELGMSVGGVHNTLRLMTERGLIEVDRVQERAGRSLRFFRITDKGKGALAGDPSSIFAGAPLTVYQREILASIAKRPRTCPELSDRGHGTVPYSQVFVLVARMAERGLVERDGKLVRPTAAGLAALGVSAPGPATESATDPVNDDPTATPLKRLRTARGLTQADLAQRSGVHSSQVLRIERGQQPRKESALAIAKALGVPAAEIFPGMGASEPPPIVPVTASVTIPTAPAPEPPPPEPEPAPESPSAVLGPYHLPILEMLATRDRTGCTGHELSDQGNGKVPRRKVFDVLRRMKEDSLVDRDGSYYRITKVGRAFLASAPAGKPKNVPRVKLSAGRQLTPHEKSVLELLVEKEDYSYQLSAKGRGVVPYEQMTSLLERMREGNLISPVASAESNRNGSARVYYRPTEAGLAALEREWAS